MAEAIHQAAGAALGHLGRAPGLGGGAAAAGAGQHAGGEIRARIQLDQGRQLAAEPAQGHGQGAAAGAVLQVPAHQLAVQQLETAVGELGQEAAGAITGGAGRPGQHVPYEIPVSVPPAIVHDTAS